MSIRAARIRGPIAFWALAGLALLLSHDAVFLVQLGPGEGLVRALRGAGHDYWGAASTLLGGVGLLAALAMGIRLRRLRRQASDLGARPSPSRNFGRRTLSTWVALTTVVALAFMLQESAEHLIVHGHVIGLDALVGPEYPLAVPVIAAITSVASLVARLISGAELGLVAAIAAVLARRRPRAAATCRPARASTSPHRSSILSRPGASRAPPGMLAS
jgi:hypothetical protein